jgi:hypothetical protein
MSGSWPAAAFGPERHDTTREIPAVTVDEAPDPIMCPVCTGDTIYDPHERVHECIRCGTKIEASK